MLFIILPDFFSRQKTSLHCTKRNAHPLIPHARYQWMEFQNVNPVQQASMSTALGSLIVEQSTP